jgi:hypothetical protein
MKRIPKKLVLNRDVLSRLGGGYTIGAYTDAAPCSDATRTNDTGCPSVNQWNCHPKSQTINLCGGSGVACGV